MHPKKKQQEEKRGGKRKRRIRERETRIVGESIKYI
jgi:hypothetical protein